MAGPVARLACNLCCYIYPAYASYKALSLPNSGPRGQPQGSSYVTPADGTQAQGLGDETIERWLMYWSVVGIWTAVETTVGWSFTWIPFYSVFKLVVFLYFALPQTQGSSFVYNRFLAPTFAEHEADIDAALGNLRLQATTSLTDALGYIWRAVQQQLNGNASQLTGQVPPYGPSSPYPSNPQHPPQPNTQHPAPPAPPPSFQDPAGGAATKLYSFLGRYAGQYIPVAATALQAAAAAASGSRPLSNGQAREMVGEVHEALKMPVPVPTPAPSGSRTMSYAQTGAAQTSSRAPSYSDGMDARMRNVSSSSFHSAASASSNPSAGVPSALRPGMPPLSHQSSQGSSDSSRSSFSGLGYGLPSTGSSQQVQGQWGGESFETISHADAPTGSDGSPSRPERPEGRRTSSWFSRGRDEREKTE